VIEKVLSIKQEARNMNATDIDIGHDKGLDVLYVANEPVEIVDIGHDKGQSVPYNTVAVVGNESGHDKGQSERIGNTGELDVIIHNIAHTVQYVNGAGNKDEIANKETTNQLSDKV
jgi:hypothetical protein